MTARYFSVISVVLLVLVTAVNAADLATNTRIIQGTWYCPPTQDLYHRFDFNPDGTFMWLSYSPSRNKKYSWEPSFTEPWHYSFRTATKIDVSNNGTILIESLAPDRFRFSWISYGVKDSYACSRTRPPGDTDDSRVRSALLKDIQKKPFLGRWKTTNGNEYVEFLPGDICIKGILKAGRWDRTKYKFNVYYEGEGAMCGDSGMFSRKPPNKIILDYGMGGTPITYHRTNPLK